MESVFFPLKGVKIWSQSPEENRNLLQTMIKESLLLFEVVRFQRGVYRATYGKTASVSTVSPYNPSSFSDRFADGAMGAFSLSASRENVLDPKVRPLVHTTGRTYSICYEAMLDSMSENCSKSELGFIKLLPVLYNDPDASKVFEQNERDAVDELDLPQNKNRIDTLCAQYDIPTFSRQLLVKEAREIALLSRELGYPVMLDPLHEQYISGTYQPVASPNTSFRTVFPNFGSCDLADIIELRKHPAIEKFRGIITDDSARGGNEALFSELLKDIKGIEPASIGEIILKTGAEVFAPPLSLVNAIDAGIKREEFSKSISHFCLELNKKAHSKPESLPRPKARPRRGSGEGAEYAVTD